MEKQIHSPLSETGEKEDFVRHRARRIGTTMVVMGASFALYYLGFFGGVAGPLEPARLGASLAGLGVTQRHVLVILLSILIMAVTWNWIVNLVGLITGARLCCIGSGPGKEPCGAPVRRERNRTGLQYVCVKGHRHTEAHFHPVRKGTISHTIWVTALAFCLVVIFTA